MKLFPDTREAKEFLVAQITTEAQREGVPLSELERQMLYFTESGWTPPNMMETAEKFDDEYDQDEYEAKIAKLVRNGVKHARKTSREDYERWWSAIRVLKRGDHYINIPITRAHLRPPGDILRLWMTAVLAVCALLFLTVLSAKFNLHYNGTVPERGAWAPFVWGTILCATVLYWMARWLFGKRVDDWLGDLILRIIGKSDLIEKRAQRKTR